VLTSSTGSAWEYDEATGEYYLHLFTKEQPDLNWENPRVRDAVHDIMRFWLDRGIDGFRLDVINFISKDQSFPDSDQLVLKGSEYYAAGPRLHEYLRGIGDILDEYHAFSVGEMPCVYDPEEIIKSVGASRGELSMIFHFDLVTIDYGPLGKYSPREWTVAELAHLADKWQRFMYDHDGWNALYIENHDQPRSVSRYTCDCPKHRVQGAKLLASFLGLQAGTLFVYQGQELGMVNIPKGWPLEEYKDVEIWNHWEKYKNASPEVQRAVKAEYQKKSRDSSRTPMQWDVTPHAGFTSPKSQPWIRVNPSYHQINAAAELADPDSPFHFWKKLLAVRKLYKDVFVYGDFDLVGPDPHDEDAKVVVYRRVGGGHEAYVVCNFGMETAVWDGLPGEAGVGRVILGSLAREGKKVISGMKMELEAFETVVVFV
jgi:glycosidase